MTQAYNPKDIEPKWQAFWEKEKTFEVDTNSKKPKFYGLIEFPYPSGAGLHVGHPRSYTAMDVITRKKRMEGYNALFPIGFDAFGLPTENFAIKTGRAPADVTAENIATFTRQLKSLGFGFDWSRTVDTTDPTYYKWTQWIFLQLFKHGLAYKKNQPINWCPKDKIGLANEEVVNGGCERCGTPVEKRDKEQWMLGITKYADSLVEGLKDVDYIERAKVQQENWIGKSEGAEIVFTLRVPGQDEKHTVTVFTTRPDTLFGVTFLAVAPELAKKWLDVGWKADDDVKQYVEKALAERVSAREAEPEKTGVPAGITALHPVTNEEIPVWITNYVMGDVGTGAIMAVPAHDERDFEFAKKFNLPIKYVVFPLEFYHLGADGKPVIIKYNKENISQIESRMKGVSDGTGMCYEGDGICANSEFLNDLEVIEAQKKMITWLEEKSIGKYKVNYKLRDWVFSRQRYWGEPIPLVFCASCAEKKQFQNKGEEINPGWIALDDSDLPLTLPEVEKYQPTDTGESPLAAMTEWVNTTCPHCGGAARRETDTMPNWAGSSWYFLRYMDPKNDSALASKEALKYWAPVDWYNGGMEHTVLHLLYSRFWNQFLFDIGVVPTREPYKRRTSHGMILAKGGEKMSKSKGNVVNPDEMVEQFGADALRAYILFMGPFDQAVEWDTNGLIGIRRMLERLWKLQDVVAKESVESLEQVTHETVKKVGEDIDAMRFNTAVSQITIWVNEATKQKQVGKAQYEMIVKAVSPLAPHIAEELWQVLGGAGSVALSAWPSFDPKKLVANTVTIAIQINGKLRHTIELPADVSEEEATASALKEEKVQGYLQGNTPKKVIYIKGKLVSIVM